MTTIRPLRPARLRSAVAAAVLAVGLVAAPVGAAEEPAEGAVTEEGATTEEGGHGEEEGGHGEGDGKIELPLDTEKPRDAVGLIMLGVIAAGVALAFENMRRQMKGERGQATGEWRYR